MARLAFCDYHNMITILEKYEHNQDFHQIVDFVEASHIRYALTFNTTVYVSHIRQFWSTARIETTEEGTKILATVDGKLSTVSESSIRRNHKLNDEAGISSLLDAELFGNLQLMGYNILPNQKFIFQKGQFSHQWMYLIHTIMQYTRRTRIAQSSFLLPVANEPTSPLGDDSQGEACLTDSGFEAEQDRENIANTSTLPNDSTPRVTSLAADEGSMQYKLDELTALCTILQRKQSEMVSKFEAQELEINRLKTRNKLLEDKDRGVADQSGDDAPIKGRRLDEGEEAAERVSDDTGEMATVLTSMDAASILTSGGVQVVPTATEVATSTVSIPTGSGMVSTTSPTIPTAALSFTTATESTVYTKRKGKETMVESDTPTKKKAQEPIDVQLARELEEELARDAQRMNEQIARDAEIARIHAEEELQMLIDGLDRNNETVAKYLQEYDQFAAELPFERRIELISDLVGWKAKHFKGMTLKEIKENFDPVWKQIQDFIPLGSKEEAKRFKRKCLRLEQESMKKLKTSEEVKKTEKSPEDKVHTEGQRSYWKIIRLGGSSASYQFFVDMLKHLDREYLNKLWEFVRETLSIRLATSDKDM
nr:hypothetical protein [Tanacetum cinerariifolium]